jgi:hypothetical protein
MRATLAPPEDFCLTRTDGRQSCAHHSRVCRCQTSRSLVESRASPDCRDSPDVLGLRRRSPSLFWSEVLLVFKSAIHSQENVELRGLSRGQELTVLKSREASILGGLTFVDSRTVLRSHTRRGERAFMPGPTAAVELLPARRWPSRVKRSDTLRQMIQRCGRAQANRTEVGGVLASREKPALRSGYLDF